MNPKTVNAKKAVKILNTALKFLKASRLSSNIGIEETGCTSCGGTTDFVYEAQKHLGKLFRLLKDAPKAEKAATAQPQA
jgi:hypothetical protein